MYYKREKRIDLNNIKQSTTLKKIDSRIRPLLFKNGSKKQIETQLFPKFNSFSRFNVEKKSTSLDFELVWNSKLIKYFRNDLKVFFDMQKEYTKLYFNSEFQKCEELLAIISEKFGISLWLIENYVNLYKKIDGSYSKSEEFVDGILKSKVNLLYKISSVLILLKSENILSAGRYQIELERNIKDWKIIGNRNLTEYIIYKFSLDFTNKEIDYAKVLKIEENLSIIDRCQTLLRILIDTENTSDIAISNVAFKDIVSSLETIGESETLNYLELKGLSEYTSDELIINILNDYTYGKYEEVIDNCEKIFKVKPQTIELYEVYIKSLILTKRESGIDSSNFHYEIINKISSHYKKQGEVENDNHFPSLMKIVLENSNSLWSWKLLSYLHLIYIGTKTLEKSYSVKRGFLISSYLKPQVILQVLDNQGLIEKYISTKFPIDSIIYKVHHAYNNNDIELIKSMDIESNRKNRLIANLYLLNNNYSEALKHYHFLDPSDTKLNLLEVSIGKIKSYIELNNFDKAVELIVDCYLIGCNLIFEINNSKIIDIINNFKFDSGNINFLIYIELISKYLDDSFYEKKHYYFEDFLNFNNINFISEYDINSISYNQNKLIYFLKYYCDIDTMSKYYLFENYEQVEQERISICNILGNLDPENKNLYNDEIKEITQSIQIKKYSEAFDKSKIYVDVDGIKKQSIKKIKENFERLSEYFNSSKDNYVYDKESGLTYYKFKEDKYFEIYNDIVYEIIDTFLNSDEYGLNVYLSVGIRHGTLLGQLRTLFENYNFITLFDSNLQKYKKNTYWMNKMNSTNSSIYDDINFAFINFSKNIDKHLIYLKDNVIQVTTESTDTVKLFNYHLSKKDLMLLYVAQQSTNNLTPESFIDEIIEMLWQITDGNLQKVRKYLFENLKPILEKEIEELKNSINRYSDDLELNEFNQNIINLKTELNYQIEKVSTWFTKENVIDIDNFTLELPISIALDYAKNINSKNSKVIFNKDIDSTILLVGKYLKWFVEIFISIFDNIFKRSGFEEYQDISLLAKLDSNLNLIIECKNKLSLNSTEIIKRKEALQSKLLEIQKILTTEGAELLKGASREGGSGLYKIVKIIKYDIKPTHGSKIDFGIDEENEEFYIYLSIGAGGIILENSNN